MPRVLCALASTLALAGCGELLNPDLDSGALRGRLLSASASAYVYPLGSPDIVARPAADGWYALENVPTETSHVVVVDGSAGSWRAALLSVVVEGAGLRVVPEVDASTLPAAGRVGAVARLGGGCDSTATRFTAVGTDRRDVAPALAGGAAILEPLPAGTFRLEATTPGFAMMQQLEVTVSSGATVSVDVPFEVDGEAAEPGCTAFGAACRLPLVCDGSDGVCHECLSDDDCASSSTGETVCQEHACHAPAATLRELCDSCTADSDCAAGACAANGSFCTRACAVNADCPAGFACVSEGARSVCQAPRGCDEAKEAFGAECLDASCTDHLAGCVCLGAQPALEPPVPGYCTAPCDPSRADDCSLVPGYACSASARVCEKTF
jgi:hypothetical protein